MPWCPKCKTEYREGITICADCKTELVTEYRDVLLQDATEMLVKVDAEHQMFVKKLHDFLEYSGIPSVVLNEGDMLGVYVAPDNFKKAKKCFKAFYSVETEIVMQKAEETAFMKGEEFDYFGDDDSDDEDLEASAPVTEYESVTPQKTASEDTNVSKDEKYTSAAAKYDDYHSSGVTFTVLGVLGVGFAMLNFIDVIDLFGNGFSCFVLFVIFGIFLVLGIFSFTKAEQLKESAENEKKLVAEANEWMEKNFSKDMLISLNEEDTSDDEIHSEEILYMDRLDQLVERLLEAFPNLHDSLAEQLVEDFCSHSED